MNGSARARSSGGADAHLDLIRQVFDVLPVGLGLFDASDDEFRLEYANPGFKRLLGLEISPAEVKPAVEVFRKAEGPTILQLFQTVRAARQPRGTFAADRRQADVAGNAIIWNLDLYPVSGADKQVTRIVAVAIETLEKLEPRQRQEQEALTLREKNEKLAELEKAKSQFLSLASHELRGPAATLRGYLSMLEDGSLGPLPGSIQKLVPLLRSKAIQINMLANEMVEAARLEDRRLQLKLRPVDLAEVIRESIENVRPAAEPNHEIFFQNRVPGPAWVMGDPMRLDIIVSNLVDNAIKYSPGGGDVDCELSVARGLTMFSVRDHGIGIAAEDMSKLFIRFSRLAADRLADVPGTGLGLYLARELARLHGGDIIAISKLDEGSEFTFTIPQAAEK